MTYVMAMAPAASGDVKLFTINKALLMHCYGKKQSIVIYKAKPDSTHGHDFTCLEQKCTRTLPAINLH